MTDEQTEKLDGILTNLNTALEGMTSISHEVKQKYDHSIRHVMAKDIVNKLHSVNCDLHKLTEELTVLVYTLDMLRTEFDTNQLPIIFGNIRTQRIKKIEDEL